MNRRVYAAVPLSRLLDLAADAVAAVRGGRSLTDVLAQVPPDARPGVQALSFHVLRWLGSAQALRERLAPRKPDPAVDALLLTSLALLVPAQERPYPDHTVVSQAVAAARDRQPHTAGFVNAVLRRFVREREGLVEALARDPVARWNHPRWWIERLRADWPEQADGLLSAAQARPPMALRVNTRRRSRADYLEALTAQDLPWRLPPPLPGLEHLIWLERAVPVAELPGFELGWVSVQDAHAQRAAPLLLGAGLPEGARVLDACAAPGGKTAHLLECAALDVLALDSDPLRLARVEQTLARLGLQASVRQGDATQPEAWWDGRPFDAILLDAPCSASGIVRRHPDIRWLRQPADIGRLAAVQARMLDALWPLLKPGGRLLYATCSVFRAEGQAVIDAFLQRRADGQAVLDPGAPGHLLPLPHNAPMADPAASAIDGDGFFYALLHKP